MLSLDDKDLSLLFSFYLIDVIKIRNDGLVLDKSQFSITELLQEMQVTSKMTQR